MSLPDPKDFDPTPYDFEDEPDELDDEAEGPDLSGHDVSVNAGHAEASGAVGGYDDAA